MVSSKEWWATTKNDPAKFSDWLLRQYRGEVTAAQRIRLLASQFDTSVQNRSILAYIANQEENHATWVKTLIRNRGIEIPEDLTQGAEKRYWAKTLPGIDSFETGAAVAAHAEKMRLERIKAIAGDPEAPEDVRSTFSKILVDEEFHERAFRRMTNDSAYAATEGNHELGKEALGLEA
jgi:rubrerythrin